MLSRKKRNIIFVNTNARPSRFLVDLLHANKPKAPATKGLVERFVLRFKKKEPQSTAFGCLVFLKRIFSFARRSVFVFQKILFYPIRVFILFSYLGAKAFRIFSGVQAKIFRARAKEAGEPTLAQKESASSKHFSFFKKRADKKEASPDPGRFFHLPPFRAILRFAVLLLAIVLPFKAFMAISFLGDLKLRVMGISAAAISDIKSASHSAVNKDFTEASKDFSAAGKNFLSAQKEISNLKVVLDILGALVPNDDIRLAKNAGLVLEAGRLSALIGSDLSRAFAIFQEEEVNLEKILNSLSAESGALTQNILLLDQTIQSVDARALPDEYRENFLSARKNIALAGANVKEFFEIIKAVRVFLGFEQDKRYLFVFQNNAEMRASGGFIGSFAVVDFRNGEIIKTYIPGGGSYDTEGGFNETIASPVPLSLVNARWHFWDANWWPDWPKSAGQLESFYEKSGGSTVDGVISFTPNVVEGLLRIIGPIDLREKYGFVISADNFWQTVQTLSEQKPEDHPDYAKYARLRAELFNDPLSVSTASSSLSGATSTEALAAGSAPFAEADGREPKKIIGDMFEVICSELKNKLNKESFFALSQLVLDSLNEKHILLYFNEPELEAMADGYAWTGRMKNTSWDYLMAVNTNIAGAKTDRVIAEEISHRAEVSADGTIIDTLEIRRRHNGRKGDAFTGVRNVDWLRIYVPQGSRLLSASGFSRPDEKFFDQAPEGWSQDEYVAATEGRAFTDPNSGVKIYDEAGKTVFANWCMVDPGEVAVIRFKYVLPFRVALPENDEGLKERFLGFVNPEQKQLIPYSFLAQKQPGTPGSKFLSELILPENFQTVWHYGASQDSFAGYSGDLKTDRYQAVLLEKE